MMLITLVILAPLPKLDILVTGEDSGPLLKQHLAMNLQIDSFKLRLRQTRRVLFPALEKIGTVHSIGLDRKISQFLTYILISARSKVGKQLLTFSH
jgi:hypothetical protein